MQTLLLLLIRAYRLIFSPWVGNQCRFYPTCSVYAEQAIHTHGVWRGTLMMFARIAKCHPWHAGGMDPVPPAKK